MNHAFYDEAVVYLNNISAINDDMKELNGVVDSLSDKGGSMILKICTKEKELTIRLPEKIGESTINKLLTCYTEKIIEQKKELNKLIDGTVMS